MNKKQIILTIVIILILLVVNAIWQIRRLQDENNNIGTQIPLENQLSTNILDDNIPIVLDQDTVKITSLDLDGLKSQNIPMILDFGSDSCAPCIEMAPALEKVYQDYRGKAIVTFSDVWEDPSLADGFPIVLIPTQVFYEADGTPYKPSDEVISLIPSIKIQMSSDNTEHLFTTHTGALTEAQMVAILNDMGVSL